MRVLSLSALSEIGCMVHVTPRTTVAQKKTLDAKKNEEEKKNESK